MPLSPGKQRRLRQITSSRGTFAILAIDHRGPLRRHLAAQAKPGDIDRELAGVKEDIVRALAPEATAVLLDPELGLPACAAARALPGSTSLLIALDTGSTGDPARTTTGLVPGWDAAAAARAGAAGVKLLVYYHPETPEAAQTEALVRTIALDCARAELPLFLEPLLHSTAQPGRSLQAPIRRRLAAETARRLAPLGIDVLKLEFPVHINEDTDEALWRDACQELNAACSVPWVLLSAGVTFETFLRQARVACEAGAAGVMAGRAVWHEAITINTTDRRSFLQHHGRERMHRLACLCEALARPCSRASL